jgi:hypothetical protein
MLGPVFGFEIYPTHSGIPLVSLLVTPMEKVSENNNQYRSINDSLVEFPQS